MLFYDVIFCNYPEINSFSCCFLSEEFSFIVEHTLSVIGLIGMVQARLKLLVSALFY